ncbi:MAG TPA: CPBP family intramembrane glutamic endopeptidase [Spirochaetota bacterium]|nr:CPBP family intramembrane glutamic endopeptidase [Spirochaetota bacterium]
MDMLGGLGPTITPWIALAFLGQRKPFQPYIKSLFRYRVGLLWHIIVLVLPYIIQLVSFGVSALVDRNASLSGNLQPWYMIFAYFPFMIAGGGLEEWGWRGIALPELEKRYNAVVSTFILGAVWSLWHLPLFFIPGVVQYEMSLISFALSVMAMSFILTWIYNST